jgi:hypothetical protein
MYLKALHVQFQEGDFTVGLVKPLPNILQRPQLKQSSRCYYPKSLLFAFPVDDYLLQLILLVGHEILFMCYAQLVKMDIWVPETN